MPAIKEKIYRPTEKEPFMNERQRDYFRERLLAWKEDILREAKETLQHLQDENQNHPDLADRASSETDRAIELRARDRQRKRMIAQVQRATLVIANPTHYAVALRYVREEGGAPVVVAKGQDLIALKIREVATQHDVPIFEDKALARSLYKAVEVDKMIPAEFYKAVAAIVYFILARKGDVRPA